MRSKAGQVLPGIESSAKLWVPAILSLEGLTKRVFRRTMAKMGTAIAIAWLESKYLNWILCLNKLNDPLYI